MMRFSGKQRSDGIQRHAQSVALFLSVCLLAAASVAASSPGDVGTPAADFALQDIDDVTHILSDQQGKVVLLFMIGWG